MTFQVRHALVVELPHQRQEAGLVGRGLQVGGAQQERLVAFIGAAVDQVGRLGVGTRDDDAGHAHHVELEPCGVEPFELLVGRHQHLAALMAALLGAGALVLDVISGHAGFDEAADQVAHMRITTVAGVGVGDDERPVVVCRGRGALLVGHLQPQVLLIAVGGEQSTHQGGGLVGHLAERIAGQIGPRVLADGALRRRRPAAEVDALDSHPLHHHGLAGGVGAERRDALLLGEQFAQSPMERRRGLARHDVVGRDGAALLDDLTGRVQAGDAVEARTVEVPLRGGDLFFERGAVGIGFADSHGFTLLFSGFAPDLTTPGLVGMAVRPQPHELARTAINDP